MKPMLKLIILAAFLCFFTSGSFAQQQINSFDVSADIKKDGTVNITETIKYDFDTTESHGMYRYIPFLKTNQDGKKFRIQIDGVDVSNPEGVSYKYDKYIEGGNIVLKIGDPNVTVVGENIYVIKYKVSGGLSYFDTFDEFYWNAVGASWPVPILSSEVTYSFSEPFGEGVLEGICFTGEPGSTQQNCSVEVGTNGVSFKTGRIAIGEGFTAAVKFPKGYATQLEPEADRSSILAKIFGILLGIAGTGFYLVLPLFLFFKLRSQSKKLQDSAKIVSAWFSAPKTPGGEQLTPVETVITANVGAGIKAIPATLVSLAQRGYIKIIQKEGKEFSFVKTEKSAGSELRDYEKDLYNAIFKDDKNEVSTKELSSSTKFGTVSLALPGKAGKFLEKEHVFEKDPINTSNGYTILGALALMAMNILLAIVAFVFGRKSAKRTPEGVQTYSEAMSLKNFLISQDPQFDFQAQEMMFFEKLLPYATAFGVEDIWVKRFKDLFNTNPAWYEGQDFARLAVLNNVVASSYRTATSTRSSSGFSSGFSGGHSGGGGGGGGGGSW